VLVGIQWRGLVREGLEKLLVVLGQLDRVEFVNVNVTRLDNQV